MKFTKTAVFGPFCALLVEACGGQMELPPPTPSPTSSMITADDTPAGHEQVARALQTAGHQCEDSGKAIACDAKKEGAFTFAIVFASDPHRLVIVVPSTLKVPCADALPRLNALNHEFETVTLSCENADFAAAGVLFVPSGGLTATDINAFVSPWLTQLATIISANKLDEIVK